MSETLVQVMVLVITALGGFGASVVYFSGWEIRRTQAALAKEQERVTELLGLLEARSAPAEYAAYIQPEPPDTQRWLTDSTGLISVPYEDD